uniref:Uncharacterized protein n=1 Tax=Anguilla anguilla TaxID=7936 RepID=A0A0E9U4F4_ANGAN
MTEKTIQLKKLSVTVIFV